MIDTDKYASVIDYLADDNKIADLFDEIKRLQDALKEAVEVVKEMEVMAYTYADPDAFANHALEFMGNVRELLE